MEAINPYYISKFLKEKALKHGYSVSQSPTLHISTWGGKSSWWGDGKSGSKVPDCAAFIIFFDTPI